VLPNKFNILVGLFYICFIIFLNMIFIWVPIDILLYFYLLVYRDTCRILVGA